MTFKTASNKTLYLFAIFLAILLQWHHDIYSPTINPDGVLYLYTAKQFLLHGASAAKNLYSPLPYPILIAICSKIFHVSLFNAVKIINLFSLIITMTAFLKLIEAIGGNKPLQWIGLLILVAFTTLTHLSTDAIRDNPYWSFYLLTLLSFIYYLRTSKLLWLISWGLCAIISAQFRLEGIMLLLLTPVAMLYYKLIHTQTKKVALLSAGIACGIVFLLLLIIIGVIHFEHITLNKSNVLVVFYNEAKGNLIFYRHGLAGKVGQLKQYIISPLSDGGVFGFIFLSIGIYLNILIYAFSWAYSLLALYAIKHIRRFKIHMQAHYAIWVYIGIYFLITATYFLAENLYLVNRYVMPICLAFALYLPFALQKLYQAWSARKQTNNRLIAIYFPLVALLIFSNVLASFHHFGPSKRYQYLAGQWLKHHSSPSAVVYTNLAQLHFYSDRETRGDICSGSLQTLNHGCFLFKNVSHQPWQGYDYLALNLKSKQKKYIAQVSQAIGKQPTKIFKEPHHHHKMLVIWKLG